MMRNYVRWGDRPRFGISFRDLILYVCISSFCEIIFRYIYKYHWDISGCNLKFCIEDPIIGSFKAEMNELINEYVLYSQ